MTGNRKLKKKLTMLSKEPSSVQRMRKGEIDASAGAGHRPKAGGKRVPKLGGMAAKNFGASNAKELAKHRRDAGMMKTSQTVIEQSKRNPRRKSD